MPWRHRRPVQQLPRLRGDHPGRDEERRRGAQPQRQTAAAQAPGSNLFQFRAGTGEDRCVLDSITSLQNGADLLWIETEKPHVEQIAGMMDRIRAIVPNAKLAYNNSPSFNWTLSFRQQVYDAWQTAGRTCPPTTARADERGLRCDRIGRRGR